jgi:hypothetical protein
VDRSRELRPGVLRYMDNGTDFGSTIDNMIAVPFARQRAGYSQNSAEQDDIPIGLVEFLQLCQAIDAEPRFTVPNAVSTTEMQNLIQFLKWRCIDEVWRHTRVARPVCAMDIGLSSDSSGAGQ